MTPKRERRNATSPAEAVGQPPETAPTRPPEAPRASRGPSFFRRIVERAGEPIYLLDGEWRLTYLNPAVGHLTGFEPGVLLGTCLLDLVREDHRAHLAKDLNSLVSRGGSVDLEFPIVTATGEERWLCQRTQLVPSRGRRVVIQAEARDATTERRTRELLTASEGRLRARVERQGEGLMGLTDLVYIQDLEGKFLNVNEAVVQAYGYSREELLGQTPELLADPQRYDPSWLAERLRLAVEGYPQRFEFWARRKDGTVFPKEVVLTRTEYLGYDAVMAVARDISESKRAQAESERLARLSRENPNPVLECDASGRPVHVNPAAAAIARELELESVEQLLPLEHAELVAQSLDRAEGFQGVETVVAGRVFEWTYRPHVATAVVHLFASEVTGRRRTEEQLRHHALHDALTDLPNRLLFMERLEHAVQRARRHGDSHFAVLFVDLDRFKVINDSLGHQIGDDLLVTVADRLRGSVRLEDTVARFGGDEFAILVESIGDVSDAVRVAERIHESLALPIPLAADEFVVGCSVGIALGASPDLEPADLLRHADAAMYRAKARGSAGFEVFDPSAHGGAPERTRVEGNRRAAEEGGAPA